MVSTSLVTRSAAALEMDTPSQIVIKPSKVDPERLGVWCKELIKEGTKFGPFVGEKAYEVDDSMDPAYIWEIVDIETKEFLFYINATNPHSGNWMRHIKCARYFEEQNILSEQEGIDIFYQAIKDICPGEELLTWFEKSPLRKKKGKRRLYPNIKRAKTGKIKPSNSRQPSGSSKADDYADVNYISQRGRKRSVKKYWQLDTVTDSDINRDEEKLDESEEEILQELSDEDWEANEVKNTKVIEKTAAAVMPAESTTGFFQFELQVTQTAKNRLGRKVFQCDICSGIYRHSFSLKRHYIRNHINYKYVSKVDRMNCSIIYDTDPPDDNDDGKDEEAEEDKEEEEKEAEDFDDKDLEKSSKHEQNRKNGPTLEVCKKATDNEADFDGSLSDEVEKLPKKDSVAKEDNKLLEKHVGDSDAGALENVAKSNNVSPKSKANKGQKSPPDEGNVKKLEETLSGVEVDEKEGAADSETKIKYPMPGLYRCNICEKLFDTVDQLKEHFHNHPSFPSDKKFSCEHCKMKFKHKQNLMRHEVVHTGAKPYICNHCNKRFPTLTNQKRHERIHKGQKFTCSQCPGTFTQTGDLKKHMCKQHPETYNECAYCSKYFSSESVLAGHLQKVHNKDIEANHQKICARKKARKVSLEKDRAESRRLASDQAESYPRSDPSLQFACTICRKRFRDYSNMCRHRRLAHEREASNLESQWGNLDECSYNDIDGFFSDTDSQPDGEKMDSLQMYFSHVSHNISDNLQHYIEGKQEQLTRASSHIRWKHKSAQEKIAAAEVATDIKLEEFNFPEGFHIRQLSELYESPAVENVKVVDDKPSSEKLQNLDDKVDEKCLTKNGVDLIADLSADINSDSHTSSVNTVDKGLMIRVPTVKSCSLCHSIFHNNESFINHMIEKHNQPKEADMDLCEILTKVDGIVEEECSPVNYSTKVSDHNGGVLCDKKVDCEELPLDLSATATSHSPSPETLLVPKAENESTVDAEASTGDNANVNQNKLGKKFLCLVCFSEFVDLEELVDHQNEHHASVDCRHAEVDANFCATWCKQPNPVGTLNVSSSQLPKQLEEGQRSGALPYVCTKCKQEFPSSYSLHQHISECGDYWRQLNTRVTWVFVLRGSELPVEKVVKKRGKFHWSNSPEESSRRQLQRMLLQQHLGETPSDGSTSKGRFGRSVLRIKSLDSVDDETDLRRNRWRHGHQSAYNPRRHVRRREMAELVDVQKCRGCREEFKTILQLERHIPVCAEKNRIKDLHAEKTENGENSDEENDYDPSKHMCIYCERQFTYLRMLKKHVNENCLVRKEFVEKGEYVDEDWEQEIANKIQLSSRDSSQNFNETVVADDGDATLDNRRNKRRKRGNNWGCRAKTKKSFKSSKSSDDGDSLFGWEDAVLSTWAKKEGNQLKLNSSKSNDNQAVTDVSKPDAGKAAENVLDSSSALQKLLTGDLNPEYLEATAQQDDKQASTDCQETSEVQCQPTLSLTVDASKPESPSPAEQGTGALEAEEALAPNTSSSEQVVAISEDESSKDLKQVLITKIQSKIANTGDTGVLQEDNDIPEEKSVSCNAELDGQVLQNDNVNDSSVKEETEGKEDDSNNGKDDKVVEEEVPNVRTKKRRGPRLTMKSKKRKNVNTEKKTKSQKTKQSK